MCGAKHLKYAKLHGRIREQISLPSSFQMELLFKIKNKKISSGNKESQSLSFPVACLFNGLPR